MPLSSQGNSVLKTAATEYNQFFINLLKPKGGYTLVTLPRIVTRYRDSVD